MDENLLHLVTSLVIILLHCEVQSDQFYSIWLYLSREYSLVLFTMHHNSIINKLLQFLFFVVGFLLLWIVKTLLDVYWQSLLSTVISGLDLIVNPLMTVDSVTPTSFIVFSLVCVVILLIYLFIFINQF